MITKRLIKIRISLDVPRLVLFSDSKTLYLTLYVQYIISEEIYF